MRRLLALATLSVAMLLGGTLYLIIAEGSGSSDRDAELDFDEELDGDSNGSENARLDALYDDCDDGDMEACDDLYWDSPVDSFYEEFGSTCGNRERETRGDCT